jgi:hypothetical protein
MGRSKKDSLRRRESDRNPNPIILIVCEGRETEPQYFKALQSHLKLRSPRIIVKGLGISFDDLIKKARELKQQERLDEDDQVWCVFDVENALNAPKLVSSIQLAANAGIHLAVSNPAFEYWFLLHYETTNRPFQNADAVIAALKKYLPLYVKNTDVFYRLLKILPLETAVERAKHCREQHADFNGESNPYPNASTTVYLLMRLLLDNTGR